MRSGEVGEPYLTSYPVLTTYPDFGIFLAFCVSNWALVYFFIYTVRVRGWSFGFSYVFGGMGKLLRRIRKPFAGKK